MHSGYQEPCKGCAREMRSAILIGMDVVGLTRQLIDIQSITGSEAAAGEFLVNYLRNLGTQSSACRSRLDDLTSALPRQIIHRRLFSSLHTLIRCHHLSTPVKMTTMFMVAALAMRKGLSQCKSRAAEKLRALGIECGLLYVVGEERGRWVRV